jgi:hypothetical protein
MEKQRLEEMLLRLQMMANEIARGEGVKIDLSEPDQLFELSNNTYSLRLTITEVKETDNLEYEKLCRKVGFTQNVIGQSLTQNGSLYRIVNIKTKNRKYPVIASSRLGTLYKFSVETVKMRLGGDKLINRNANLDKLISDIFE